MLAKLTIFITRPPLVVVLYVCRCPSIAQMRPQNGTVFGVFHHREKDDCPCGNREVRRGIVEGGGFFADAVGA